MISQVMTLSKLNLKLYFTDLLFKSYTLVIGLIGHTTVNKVNDEINNAISSFRKTDVIKVGDELVRIPPKEVTAIYVNRDVFYELLNIRGFTNFYQADHGDYRYCAYRLFMVDDERHPRVRIV